MENYSYSSYPDSGHSSPRSREVDCENASWDDPPSSNYKVKFMCSYGGKIHPRPHDNQLSYVGGDTKILAVDRTIKFSAFISKLSSLCDSEVCFKYQLPGEDLDALISVTNDEDLDHMMLEYDRLYRGSAKPARLRLFLFPVNTSAAMSFSSSESKSERQWFVDALNSVQIQSLEDSSPPENVESTANPDFLFGFDKGHSHAPPSAATKLEDPCPVPGAPEVFSKEINIGSDCGSEDRQPVVSPAEMQRQMHEFQRFQIDSHDQTMLYHRKNEESSPRVYPGEFYAQKVHENVQPIQPAVPVPIPAGYWQERHMTTGGYPAPPPTEQPVYLVQTAAGMYQTPTMRPVTGQVGQTYYGMQRVVPEVYREQPVYHPASFQQQTKIGGYTEAIGMVRTQGGEPQQGYAQVSYDGAGRQVYYTTPAGVVPPQYQTTTAAMMVDVRQGGAALNQEGNIK